MPSTLTARWLLGLAMRGPIGLFGLESETFSSSSAASLPWASRTYPHANPGSPKSRAPAAHAPKLALVAAKLLP